VLFCTQQAGLFQAQDKYARIIGNKPILGESATKRNILATEREYYPKGGHSWWELRLRAPAGHYQGGSLPMRGP
jgi:hypothetical protein